MHWRGDESLSTRSRFAASSVTGSAFQRVAKDVTAASARRSCLVLAPHPDDETLACGATLARKVDAGAEVHVLVLTDGSTWPPDRAPADNVVTRHAELLDAAAALGLPDEAVTQLAFPERGLAEVEDEVTDAIADAVKRFDPDEVFSTSVADPQRDHAALGRATARAMRGSARRWAAYPVWQWQHPRAWLLTLRAGSRPEAVSTSGYLARKRQALAEYRSQIAMTRSDAAEYRINPFMLRHFTTAREVFFPLRPR